MCDPLKGKCACADGAEQDPHEVASLLALLMGALSSHLVNDPAGLYFGQPQSLGSFENISTHLPSTQFRAPRFDRVLTPLALRVILPRARLTRVIPLAPHARAAEQERRDDVWRCRRIHQGVCARLAGPSANHQRCQRARRVRARCYIFSSPFFGPRRSDRAARRGSGGVQSCVGLGSKPAQSAPTLPVTVALAGAAI